MLKFNPELSCIRVNNSKSSLLSADDAEFFFFSLPHPGPLACTRRLFIFQRDSPPRNHADFRNYHILASAHACLSLSLSRSLTGAIMKRAPPTTYPSPLPPLFLHSSRNSRAKSPCPSRETYLPLNISVRAR